MPSKGTRKVAAPGGARNAAIYIGTSGWHYVHWNGVFYPPEVKGYNELTFYAERFATVENNSSFYRIARESTYKTWDRMTPDGFKFSVKLNRSITHIHRLKLEPVVEETVGRILATLQVLGPKLGALVIQLPASFTCDVLRLEAFLAFLRSVTKGLDYPPDLAIEFRSDTWFLEEVYAVLRKYSVALVAAQSSRYPGTRHLTSDIAYVRLHGPAELFASSYSLEELSAWASYIKESAHQTKRIYVYFNNDIGGHALRNASELARLIG